MTFVDSEPNPSGKASESWICPGIKMRLVPKDWYQKGGFSLSPGLGKCRQGHYLSKREKGDSSERRHTGLVRTSWESCLVGCRLFQFWEILTFRSPDGVLIQSGVGTFFRCFMWLQESVPRSLVAQSTTWYRLFIEAEISWEVSFLMGEISRKQGGMPKVIASQKHTVKKLPHQSMVNLIEAIRPLQ